MDRQPIALLSFPGRRIVICSIWPSPLLCKMFLKMSSKTLPRHIKGSTMKLVCYSCISAFYVLWQCKAAPSAQGRFWVTGTKSRETPRWVLPAEGSDAMWKICFWRSKGGYPFALPLNISPEGSTGGVGASGHNRIIFQLRPTVKRIFGCSLKYSKMHKKVV